MKHISLLLRASVVWSVLVWAVLIKNMITDATHPTLFRVVHIVIAVVSLAFASVSWLAARKLDRAPQL